MKTINSKSILSRYCALLVLSSALGAFAPTAWANIAIGGQGTVIWLQSTWGLDGKSQFAFSTNGTAFTPFGDTYQLGWGDYRGDRIGIFTYNNDAEAGYVDCASFTYKYDSPAPHANFESGKKSAK